MSPKPAARFWLESALSVVSGVALALVLVWEDWIEVAFGVEPDGGDGSLEWLVVALCVVSTIAFTALARRDWRRARHAADA